MSTPQELTEFYLELTDPEKRLTYDAYLRDAAKHGTKPITRKQWDGLISVLAGREMTDCASLDQALDNIRDAVADSKRVPA